MLCKTATNTSNTIRTQYVSTSAAQGMCERHHWNTLSYYLSRSNAQRICANGPYDSGRVTRFARFNGLFRRLITRQQSVDISFSPGPQQQTRVEAERGGRMGKTDGRTLYRYMDPAPRTMRAVPIINSTWGWNKLRRRRRGIAVDRKRGDEMTSSRRCLAGQSPSRDIASGRWARADDFLIGSTCAAAALPDQ